MKSTDVEDDVILPTAQRPVVKVGKKQPGESDADRATRSTLIWAVVWLVVGTTVGEYLGIKFLQPDIDTIPWLSFGRFRPVHTNMVFWGWASLALIAVAHIVVPQQCGVRPQSGKALRWITGLISTTVGVGSVVLALGINNSGGEYREYVWPVMIPFAAAILLSLRTLWSYVKARTTSTIPVTAWYILSAHIFLLTIVTVAYVPLWQGGIGETIIQGYYMHQGVGMWFMMSMLGVYYAVIPQATGGRILSQRLSLVAFWTQIVCYTVIGTHHFVFSAIPWWLQMTALVGSIGMIIPVLAGTINLAVAFRTRQHWHPSAVLFLLSLVFYVTGSLQGTLEAFEYANLVWHFTDYTVAHSHLTMYGIITVGLFGTIVLYAPRRWTTRERTVLTTLAVGGLLLYAVPLMVGGTLRGLSWLDGRPFMESVTLMMPFWTWRALGGTAMWIAHIFLFVVVLRRYRHA